MPKGKMKVVHTGYSPVGINYIRQQGFTVVVMPAPDTGTNATLYVSKRYTLPDAIKQRMGLSEQNPSQKGAVSYRTNRMNPEEVLDIFRSNDDFEIVEMG